MNPNKHVSKTYEVVSKYPIKQADIEAFESGVELSDGKVKPAKLIKGNDHLSYVTIYEGKYHQVKRMFHSIENEVLELKRIKIANLELDQSLNDGEFRFLNEQDFNNLKTNKGEGVFIMGKCTNLFRIALGIGGAVAAVALTRKDSRDKLKMNITNIKKILNHTKRMLKI